MKIHIDTDVIIDMITNREPWATDSTKVLNWAQQHPMSASVAWHSLSNLFYLTTMTQEFAKELVGILKIPATENAEFKEALSLGFSDPEDAMQVACAMKHQARYIITRNLQHYKKSPIPALTPKEFLRTLTGNV